MARTGRPTKEEQRTRKAANVPTRLLYSTKEACVLLNCGPKFLREQIDAGLLRYVPRGNYHYVSAQALQDYLINQECQCEYKE